MKIMNDQNNAINPINNIQESIQCAKEKTSSVNYEITTFVFGHSFIKTNNFFIHITEPFVSKVAKAANE